MVFVLLSGATFAENFIYVDGLSVKGVYAGYEHEGVFVEFSSVEPIDNPEGCSITTSFIAVDPTRSNVDHVLSLLVYAQAANKKVGIQLYSASCFDNHRVIRRIKVE